MKKDPVCSVIMPTHNCADYICGAIRSIFVQGVQNFEIIVIDDNSSDATEDLLDRWQSENDHIRVLRTDGVGPGVARNIGIEAARGSLIAFLDADDVWCPGKLAAQLDWHFQNPQATLSFTDYRHVGSDGSDRGTCFEFWQHPSHGESFQRLTDAPSLLLGRNLVGTSTVMARRDVLMALGGFDPLLPSSEDWELWLRLARGGPVGISGRIGCYYLMRVGSATAAREKRIQAMEMILARALAAHPRPKAADIRRARARLAVARAELAGEQGRRFGAVAHHATAAMLTPSRRAMRDCAAALALLAGWKGGLRDPA